MTDYSIRKFNVYSEDDLVSALRDVAKRLNTEFVPERTFSKYTGISCHTIERRYGLWREFCEIAGFKPVYTRTDNRDTLFQNLDEVWQKLGRQPRAKEMRQPLSAISCTRYAKLFGNWHETCARFLEWKSGLSVEQIEQESNNSSEVDEIYRHRTSRAISLSLRYEVLKRDNFKCVKCGRSPATRVGVELHIDHIIPYSRGGETELSNLQATCSDCNPGKGNRYSG
jgi:5-methylcytosine-specific restriction endonuclease McrA/uncharacterized protein YbdZ (MbtH family)